jgi:hypothetical protein
MPSYWISKAWLKGSPCPENLACLSFLVDWRLRKPKMHQPGVPDPAPDSGPFRSDVLCDHDGLVHVTYSRVKINSAVGFSLPFLISAFTIRLLGLLLSSGPISHLESCSGHSRSLQSVWRCSRKFEAQSFSDKASSLS